MPLRVSYPIHVRIQVPGCQEESRNNPVGISRRLPHSTSHRARKPRTGLSGMAINKLSMKNSSIHGAWWYTRSAMLKIKNNLTNQPYGHMVKSLTMKADYKTNACNRLCAK